MVGAPDAPPTEAAPKRSKYGNQRVVTEDGHAFDSKKEYRRSQDLHVLQEAKQIDRLELQKRYPLHCTRPDGVVVEIGAYVADFVYRDLAGSTTVVVEDVKSQATKKNALYRWKKKHFEAQYGMKITEI